MLHEHKERAIQLSQGRAGIRKERGHNSAEFLKDEGDLVKVEKTGQHILGQQWNISKGVEAGDMREGHYVWLKHWRNMRSGKMRWKRIIFLALRDENVDLMQRKEDFNPN